MGALALVLGRVQIIEMIRAGVNNDSMAACMGIDVGRMCFTVGCALAGAVAAPLRR